jgi:hypothetical protein
MANDELVANEAVPNKEPVMLPDTMREPVTVSPSVKRPEPETSKRKDGVVVPIPTLPVDLIVNLSIGVVDPEGEVLKPILPGIEVEETAESSTAEYIDVDNL